VNSRRCDVESWMELLGAKQARREALKDMGFQVSDSGASESGFLRNSACVMGQVMHNNEAYLIWSLSF
jgi:hypothetical protein